MFKPAPGVRSRLAAWRAIARRCLLVFLLAAPADAAFAAHLVASVRVWPAEDYTRVTLESKTPFSFKHSIVKNPERLVLDLENMDINAALEGLSAKVGAADPYIRSVRVGRFKPGVVRLVMDLKAEVKPSVFTLPPYGEYGHRLVLDIYPAQAADPLMALVEKPG
ncbi:MAG: AMIN domain-containing protein, partial [Pseudomonadota bacterium]